MSEENNSEENNITDNSATSSNNNQNESQPLNDSNNNANLNDQTSDITTSNSSQQQNQTENATEFTSQDSKDPNKDNSNNQNEQIANSSSSLFEFPTDLKPEEKKENNSFFGGFLDQPTQKGANQEQIDPNSSLSGLFSEIQAKNDKLNSTSEKEKVTTTSPENSSIFTFPTNQDKENKEEGGKEEFNFFGGFNDQSSFKDSGNSNQFHFSDASTTNNNTEPVNNENSQQINQNEIPKSEKEDTNIQSNSQLTNANSSEFKFSGFENSSGFGFDFNNGVFSSNDNNNSFTFKFDDIPVTNANPREEVNEPNNNDITFSPNFSDDKSKDQNKSNDQFSFNPFNSNSPSNNEVSNPSSGKLGEFLEALNSPVFDGQSNESSNSFFCKKDQYDSLEEAYKLLLKDFASK